MVAYETTAIWIGICLLVVTVVIWAYLLLWLIPHSQKICEERQKEIADEIKERF